MKKLIKLNSNNHGVGEVTFSWQPNGNFLATAGKNGIEMMILDWCEALIYIIGLVHIFDRTGEQYDEIGLDMSTPVVALEWDRDGNTLAILQSGNGIIPLWDLSARTTQNLDTNLKDPSFIKWSLSGTQLGIYIKIFSTQLSFMLYIYSNRDEQRKFSTVQQINA
jgi:WD repeat-containing protein 19